MVTVFGIQWGCTPPIRAARVGRLPFADFFFLTLSFAFFLFLLLCLLAIVVGPLIGFPFCSSCFNQFFHLYEFYRLFSEISDGFLLINSQTVSKKADFESRLHSVEFDTGFLVWNFHSYSIELH